MINGRGGNFVRTFVAFGVAITLGVAGAWMSRAAAQTGAAPGPFTDAQAQAGQPIYRSRCAACHEGGGETGPLSGANFVNTWTTRSTRDLYTRIKTTMPFNDPGSLTDADAASVVAYVLKSNGAVAGTADFTPTTAVAINTLLAGAPPQQAAQADVGQAAPNFGNAPAGGGRGGRGGRGGPPPTGITVAGTVANYTPVTEDMLLHPPASDWLMHYGNYAGWSHSPLKQVNAGNVHNLQLRWVWAMDEGERQQITPLVHDGVMFISTVVNNKGTSARCQDR